MGEGGGGHELALIRQHGRCFNLPVAFHARALGVAPLPRHEALLWLICLQLVRDIRAGTISGTSRGDQSTRARVLLYISPLASPFCRLLSPPRPSRDRRESCRAIRGCSQFS